MIAACYARKSQPDEDNVVAQVAACRAFAAARGWSIPDEFVYSDDGVSGAVFGDGRPGLDRLMRAIASPARSFGILIARDDERVGRHIWEMGRVLQLIVESGVRVFFYKSGEELKLDTPLQKMMLSLRGYSGEDYVVKVRDNTKLKLRERAQGGFAAGSAPFGYSHPRDGKVEGKRRPPVRRVVNSEEAKVVVRIFEMYAKGAGVHAIAKTLNEEKVPGPLRRRKRDGVMEAEPSRTWSQGGIGMMLKNPHYVGRIEFGRTTSVARMGKKSVMRPTDPATWFTEERPDLRIIEDKLWEKVQAARAARSGPRGTRGRLIGRAAKQDIASAYMLTGHATCKVCGGSVRVTVRGNGPAGGKVFVPHYGCGTFEGRSTCGNNIVVAAERVERAVAESIARYLDADILFPALDRALARIVEQRGPDADRLELLGRELAQLEARGRNLAAAIASGGEMGPLVSTMKDVERDKAVTQAEIADLTARTAPVDADEVKRRLVGYAKDVKALLSDTPEKARAVLKGLLRGRITMEPYGLAKSPRRGYRFSGELMINRLIEGSAGPGPLSVTSGGSCRRSSSRRSSPRTCRRRAHRRPAR